MISVLIFCEKYKLRSFSWSVLIRSNHHLSVSDTLVKFSVKGQILLQTKRVKCLRCMTHTAKMLPSYDTFWPWLPQLYERKLQAPSICHNFPSKRYGRWRSYGTSLTERRSLVYLR